MRKSYTNRRMNNKRKKKRNKRRRKREKVMNMVKSISMAGNMKAVGTEIEQR